MIGCLVCVRRPHRDSTRWRSISRGRRWSAAFCSSPCRRRSPFRLSRHDGRLTMTEPVRQAVRHFFPVMISRGALQLNGHIDAMIASLLPTGAVAAISNAQLLYMLPVSLFGVSISAAELPAMAGDAASAGGYDALRARLECRPAASRVLRRPVGCRVRRTRRRDRGRAAAARTVHGGRRAYRLGDPRRLRRSASWRRRWRGCIRWRTTRSATRGVRCGLRSCACVCSTSLGYTVAVLVPPRLGIDPIWGAAGLTLSSGLAGWLEFTLLRRSLNGRIGRTGLPGELHAAPVGRGDRGRGDGVAVKQLLPPLDPLLRGAVVLPAFGVVYITAAFVMRIPAAGPAPLASGTGVGARAFGPPLAARPRDGIEDRFLRQRLVQQEKRAGLLDPPQSNGIGHAGHENRSPAAAAGCAAARTPRGRRAVE